MTSLVTGGGGFLGLYLVEQLLERGESVRVFCRGDYPHLRELGVEIVQGDLRDPDAVALAVAGCETVYHVAAVPGIWGSWNHFHAINTLGTQNILDACHRHDVRKLIYTSSPSVVFDGKPHSNADESLPYPERYLCHYPHTKALAEKTVLKAHDPNGLRTCALRPHLIWGPRDNHLIPRLIQRAQSGRLRIVGDGENWISMSYVENAAVAHWQAAMALDSNPNAGGRAYFINEPEPVKLWEWVNDLLARAGAPPVKKTISANAAYRVGAVFEGAYQLFGVKSEPPMTRFLALQLSQTHTYVVGNASRELGYQPKIRIADAMDRMEPELQKMANPNA